MGFDSSQPRSGPPKRKHRATGNPRGGRRPGAGRPPGAKNTLPQGAVKAIRALRHRVPQETPEPLAELADEALGTVAEVMRGKVYRGGFERLQAARIIREEVCGKVADRLEVKPPTKVPVTDEEWAELARLRHQVRDA